MAPLKPAGYVRRIRWMIDLEVSMAVKVMAPLKHLRLQRFCRPQPAAKYPWLRGHGSIEG